MPLSSGAFADDSCKSPAMCINAMSKTPANPPPTNATSTHHNETICRPRFLWSRELPGTSTSAPAPPLGRPIIRHARYRCHGHLSNTRKKSGTRRTVLPSANRPRLSSFRASRKDASSTGLRNKWSKGLEKAEAGKMRSRRGLSFLAKSSVLALRAPKKAFLH